MKIATQNSAELTQLSELIEDMRVAMLTTMNDQGALVSRPMAPQEMDASGAIWFLTDQHSSKTKHLDMVNLNFSDSDDATYVSICGRGEVVHDRAMIDRVWSSFAKPWFPDGKDSPNLALLKFIPQTAEYWDAPHSKMVRMFAYAASIALARPIGMGEHDTLTGLSPSAAQTAHTAPA
jgi:general stress protein 26